MRLWQAVQRRLEPSGTLARRSRKQALDRYLVASRNTRDMLPSFMKNWPTILSPGYFAAAIFVVGGIGGGLALARFGSNIFGTPVFGGSLSMLIGLVLLPVFPFLVVDSIAADQRNAHKPRGRLQRFAEEFGILVWGHPGFVWAFAGVMMVSGFAGGWALTAWLGGIPRDPDLIPELTQLILAGGPFTLALGYLALVVWLGKRS